MRKLERKWSQELAVVGVHSPKFLSERETEAVRAAILRLNVGHPVVNDRDFHVWQAYAVRAWPTLIADTNNHAIRVASLASGDVTTLVLRGL